MNSDQMANLMRDHDIKPTRQRLSIAVALLSRPQHLSADQVLAAVRGRGEQVSKATIYNTLGLFTRNGLLREVCVDNSKIFYDSTIRPHHHIYNIETGVLQDLDSDCVTLDKLPRLPAGTVVDGVEIIIKVRAGSDRLVGESTG